MTLVCFATEMRQDGAATRAARQFAEWYTTSDKRILSLVNNASVVPVKQNLAGHPKLPEPVKGSEAQLEASYPMPQYPTMYDVWGPFGDAVREAFTTGADIEPLLRDASDRIHDAWAKN